MVVRLGDLQDARARGLPLLSRIRGLDQFKNLVLDVKALTQKRGHCLQHAQSQDPSNEVVGSEGGDNAICELVFV